MSKMKNITRIISISLCAAFLFTFAVWGVLKTADEYSDSERRKLEQLPDASLSAILSGKFTSDFDKYTLDQFPGRETFRTLKAYAQFYLFRQKDNNGIYISDGYASKLDYPLNKQSVLNAVGKFKAIYDKYIADTGSRVFTVTIPDKNYYLADKNGYPALDYEGMISLINENMTYSEIIDISGCLDISDYYSTDTHWRQEKLGEVMKKLAEALGKDFDMGDFKTEKTDVPFYGVYYGQSALPLNSETIYYLTNSVLENCAVTDVYGVKSDIYNMEKLHSKDPYEMFLSGAVPVITIENPSEEAEGELIVFRDSFGSSIAPLLVPGYSKVTLVDIRYIASDLVGNFVSFEGCDVMFMYSTMLYNNSYSFK